MAYKDKDKQREANRERQRRYRALHSEGVTVEALPTEGTPSRMETAEGQQPAPQFKTWDDLPPDVQRKIEYMSRAKADEGICEYGEEKSLRTKRALAYLNQFPQFSHLRGAY